MIDHLDQDHPVGEAGLDAQGRMHLAFHARRVYSGRAMLMKVEDGVWKGEIWRADETVWPFVLRKR